MIKTSLDWASCRAELLHKTHNLAHGREVRKMIENIQREITKLSKAEVEQRRGKKHATDEILDKVNKDIELVEEYLLVAALIG
jgi:predicted secreted Zn-dependent protease